MPTILYYAKCRRTRKIFWNRQHDWPKRQTPHVLTLTACWISPPRLYKIPSVCHSIFPNRNAHFPSLHEEQSLPIVKNRRTRSRMDFFLNVLPSGHHEKNRYTLYRHHECLRKTSRKRRGPGNKPEVVEGNS